MSEVSLEELGTAFANWRQNKRNTREPVPKALWAQTLVAAKKHGAHAVSQVTKIQRSRIVERAEKSKAQGEGTVPAFTRVTISSPSVPESPVAEVETSSGLKLRIFEQTEEMVKLLLTLCSSGGTR